MCGFAGFIQRNNSDDSRYVVDKMLSSISYRGPDDKGVWFDKSDGIFLGHCRLSILDISSAGHQPMISFCNRYLIIFNGEIYNHLELRKKLQIENGFNEADWHGHSDTETLINCISIWGIRRSLELIRGMFAFAVWDKESKKLTLARDRIGEKPLYYGWHKGIFLFGSELKSLRQHPSFINDLSSEAIEEFLAYNFIPAPLSIYKNVLKLTPGSYIEVNLQDVAQETYPQLVQYWSLEERALNGVANPYTGSFNEAVLKLEKLLHQAVEEQSIADVPVGAFLSGGIDSSIVVAYMCQQSASNVTTFSIGMTDDKLDESIHAARVAAFFGTNHVEYRFTQNDALHLITQMPKIWDEPLGDSSQLPTYLVSKLARGHVKVALSGDGGDEFFLGYSKYSNLNNIWRTRYARHLPWEIFLSAINKFSSLPLVCRARFKLERVTEGWSLPSPEALSEYWNNRYSNSDNPLNNLKKDTAIFSRENFKSPIIAGSIWDAKYYLPDDILVKVDRASMSMSLESRAPLLDSRIVEFAMTLPISYKLKNSQNKRILREILYKKIPRELVDRPKQGFSIPIGRWLREDLVRYSENSLKILKETSMFNAKVLDRIWEEHISNKKDNSEKLWGLISLAQFIANN